MSLLSTLFEKAEEDWPQHPIPLARCGQSEVSQSKEPPPQKVYTHFIGCGGCSITAFEK
jgi:hypothetical protein